MDELWQLVLRLAERYPGIEPDDGEQLNVLLQGDPDRRFLSLNRSSRKMIYRKKRLATLHNAEATELGDRLKRCFPLAQWGKGHAGGEGLQFDVDKFDYGELCAAAGIMVATVARL
jgi:hypothetical protein